MKESGAEGVVLATLMESVPETTAKFLLGMLKEEWQKATEEKSECTHKFWRYTYDEPGVWCKCDTCGKRNIVVGS